MWNTVSSNKLCFDRNIAREHTIHLRKLRNMKSRLDNLPPQRAPHLESRAKQELLRRMSDQRIKLENNLLLKKMLTIDLKPSQISRTVLLASQPASSSLNSHIRMSQLTKISTENQKFLRKLRRTHSQYSLKKWESEFRKNQYLSEKISGNAGRVPKSISFYSSTYGTLSQPTPFKSTRPVTANSHKKDSLRPATAGAPSQYS